MRLIHLPVEHRPRILATALVIHGHQPVDRWYLPGIWCLHAYDYRAELVVDGESCVIEPGTVSLLAPGTRQEYRYQTRRARHLYCHFSAESAGRTMPVPLLMDLGPAFGGFRHDLQEASRDWPLEPLRAEVRLWDLLWRLVQLAAASQQAGPPPVLRQVLARIEEHLDQPLTVAGLARERGVSHNHLTRLFRIHLGTTVIGHLRRRRAERAVDLLTHTDLPIADVARRVGIPDAQHFNKTVRAIYGRSPRRLRQEAPVVEVITDAG